MATYKTTYNIVKANKELFASHEAIDPALVTAGITTIKVDGKEVPASAASVDAKISALLAVSPPGAKSQDLSEVIQSNDHLSRQLEEVTNERDSAKAANQSMTAEISTLKSELSASRSAVETLTAKTAELENRLEASNSQVAKLTKEANGLNVELSKLCLDAGVLSIAADETDKQGAAEKVPMSEKLSAYSGAVNAAVSRIGIDPKSVPNASPKTSNLNLKDAGLLSQYNQITNPSEKHAFFKKNKRDIMIALANQ